MYKGFIILIIENEWKIIKNINQLKFYDQHYFKKNWDLRTQIDILRATEDKLSEHTDSYSEISEEIAKSEFGKPNYLKNCTNRPLI
jgi:hypothetical protein